MKDKPNHSFQNQTAAGWFAGILFLALVFISMLFIPCPTHPQFLVFRILLSIGAAGVAGFLPGFLMINHKEWLQAGGAFGVFLLVYCLNPAQTFRVAECDTQPFEFTISLTCPGIGIVPDLSGEILQIRLDNRWDEATIDEYGDADFKGIPPSFRKRKISLRLESDKWVLQQDSVLLSGKSSTVQLSSCEERSAPITELPSVSEPATPTHANKTVRISGKVMDPQRQNTGVSGVAIYWEGEKVGETEASGLFHVRLSVPEKSRNQLQFTSSSCRSTAYELPEDASSLSNIPILLICQ